MANSGVKDRLSLVTKGPRVHGLRSQVPPACSRMQKDMAVDELPAQMSMAAKWNQESRCSAPATAPRLGPTRVTSLLASVCSRCCSNLLSTASNAADRSPEGRQDCPVRWPVVSETHTTRYGNVHDATLKS